MMTRQNFEMVAGVLAQQVSNAQAIRVLEDEAGMGNERSNAIATSVSTTAYNLAQQFKADNPRFDHLRFYKACGFIVSGNYPLVFDIQNWRE